MKIFLRSLSFTNFKGIRSLNINFDPVTDIYGSNATGKTTLLDGFLWCFFGKDSSGRSDFEIKTLNENNEHYHKLDHEVGAVIMADAEEISIRRVYREKWVAKRGEKEKVFSGHETLFFWNDVPLKESEYQAKVAGLINESIFRLITNTGYFNQLKWQDRRNVLIQIAGPISDSEVIDKIANLNNKTQISLLTNALNQKKSIDEFKAEIRNKKKKIKDELDLLPSRIDEANRSLPEEVDYASIGETINRLTNELEVTEDLLMNKTKAQKAHQESINQKIQEVQKLRTRQQEIEFEEKNRALDLKRTREQTIQDKKRDLRNLQDDKDRLLSEYLVDEKRKASLETEIAAYRVKWETINQEELKFEEGEFHCPACKRAYEATDIESKKRQLLANFNTDKTRRLTLNLEQGSKLADEIKVLTAKLENTLSKGESAKLEISKLSQAIATLEEEHTRLSVNEKEAVETAIANNSEYKGIAEMIELRTEEINTPFEAEDNSSLLDRKRELILLIDTEKKRLATKEHRERIQVRINELLDQEQTMSQQFADLDGVEFIIEQYTRVKMDTLESRINGRFKIVRFKMFEEQINGGQSEACTTLINGVPYPDANNASKINAGLDIINTLSEHYGISAPVFVDNAESVVKLIDIPSQIIRLIVSGADKKLRVENSNKLVMSA